ncbi:hypothetical protein NDA11_002117 [Ustilago hordei]|nr:hypothetical protein NDA11_002117 [Ustilago hordei]KAJ1599598.1 hypothetical protein NDA14_006162 [Ustilago hordei]
MAPRHTRIVFLLLLVAIHAVGVLSAGASSSSGSGSVYIPEVNNQMFLAAEEDQIKALSSGEHTYFSKGRRKFSDNPSFANRALELAKQHGVRSVGESAQEHYFYSIIRPNTALGKDMGLKEKLGEDGYVSVLWEHNKNWEKPTIIDASDAFSRSKGRDRSFIWKLDRFKDVLERAPK